MSTSQSQPDTPESDELVSYLDGELSADDCRRVERRLASDADYRRRLTELEQAWTALEALPPATLNDDFARTTIEMVAVAAEKEAQAASMAQASVVRRRNYWLSAGGLAVAIAAFAATRMIVPDRNRALVDDLPAIAQLDVLMEVGDIDYLRGLTQLDFASATRDTASSASFTLSDADWQTIDQRRQWIESLSVNQKAELAAKFERFERLGPGPEERDRLRKLVADIDSSGNRERLEATLASYGAWLQSRTQGDKLSLRDRGVTTDERLARAERLLAESQRSMRWQLPPQDEKTLQDAILNLVDERRNELAREFKERGNREPNVAQVALAVFTRDMQDDQRRQRLQDRLTARFSPETQELFSDLGDGQQRRQLFRWVYDAMAPKFGPKNLEQFFTDELTDDQREYLLGLPLPEMQEQLQTMYARSQVGLRPDDFSRRFWRGGRDGPGQREPGRGPDDRGPRDGRRRGFDGDGFDGPPPRQPGPGGPGGPGRRPLGPPPRDGRDWRPPPGGPPPNGGPPPREMPQEQPI